MFPASCLRTRAGASRVSRAHWGARSRALRAFLARAEAYDCLCTPVRCRAEPGLIISPQLKSGLSSVPAAKDECV
jgi:hypothetical protein